MPISNFAIHCYELIFYWRIAEHIVFKRIEATMYTFVCIWLLMSWFFCVESKNCKEAKKWKSVQMLVKTANLVWKLAWFALWRCFLDFFFGVGSIFPAAIKHVSRFPRRRPFFGWCHILRWCSSSFDVADTSVMFHFRKSIFQSFSEKNLETIGLVLTNCADFNWKTRT